MVISSRTPEGTPNHCPVCGTDLKIEPLHPHGDAPCPRCGHLLWFTRDDPGDVQVIRPEGSTMLLTESLEGLFDSVALRKRMRLVLDLGGVRYLSDDSLQRLIDFKKKVDAVRGRIRLRGLHPDLKEVFRMVHLDHVFEIET